VGGGQYSLATANGSAFAGEDYEAVSLQGETIAEAASSKTHTVTIFGDTQVEPNETFTVTLSNVVGADPGDLSGTGTIVNDDFELTAINVITTRPRSLRSSRIRRPSSRPRASTIPCCGCSFTSS
jgi:hypothetical protein